MDSQRFRQIFMELENDNDYKAMAMFVLNNSKK